MKRVLFVRQRIRKCLWLTWMDEADSRRPEVDKRGARTDKSDGLGEAIDMQRGGVDPR